MAATYDLATDFLHGDELATQVPFWVMGIARYANQVTYDPRTRQSVSDSDDFALAEYEPLVLTSEVAQVRISSSKDAHVTNLSATLFPHENYLSEVMQGDWVICCLLNSETQALKVAEKMRQGQAVNGWNDGLKFLGKVTSGPRKRNERQANGTMRTSFSLQCVGFAEFDSKLFYHPQLQKNQVTAAVLQEFGVLIQNIVNASDRSVEKGTVDINKVLPALVEAVFGEGAWSKAAGTIIPDGGVMGGGVSVPASPNTKYLVPGTICGWLGLDDARTYNDLLRIMLGVQHYRGVSGATTPLTPWSLFLPEVTPLIGWLPLAPPPTQCSVWDLLSSFMNPPLNEMYVVLRANPVDGKVLPHLVIRQTPYSSAQVRVALEQHLRDAQAARGELGVEDLLGTGLDSDAPRNNVELPQHKWWLDDPARADATEFLELPRWKLPSSLVTFSDIGRSDAARFNMVHVSGTGYGALVDEVGSFVRAPPVSDLLDIKRNGLRPYLTGVNCVLRDLAKGPKVWRDIMADIVMGQHLMLSGQIACVGIQAPVAQGDNLEFEGIVFHIENISHQAGVTADGQRSFHTIFQVSHGIESEDRQAKFRGDSDERSARFGGAGDESEPDLLGTQDHVTIDEES